MKCLVLSYGPLRRPALRPLCGGPVVPIPACRRSTAFRSPPSVSAAAGRPVRRDPNFARTARPPARLCAGAVRAPDCAREAAGAPLPPVPPASFSTDARQSGLRTPLSCLEIQYISIFLDIKPYGERFLNIQQIQKLAGPHPGPFLAIPRPVRHMRCKFPHRRPA